MTPGALSKHRNSLDAVRGERGGVMVMDSESRERRVNKVNDNGAEEK